MKIKRYMSLVILITLSIVLAGCTNTAPKPTPSAATSNTTNVMPSRPTPNGSLPAQGSSSTPEALTQTSTGKNTEAPVAAESNPPGDIPDSQVFVIYTSSAGGYKLQAPEGWARTENGTDVTFVSHFDGVKVGISSVSYTLSSDNIKNNYVPGLVSSGRAVTVTSVTEVKLKDQSAVKIAYTSNSEPDPVTNKQIRLENESYLLIKNGKMAVLTLWAPSGSDNVDQWKLISESFAWSK